MICRQPLTTEQVKQLLEAVQEYPFKALLMMAITTGLRRGELLGLRWQDIDEQNEIMQINWRVSYTGEREAIGTARTIVLPAIILHVLKEHQRDQKQVRAEAGETWYDLGLVFPDEFGQPFRPGNFWQQYHALFVAAGFPYLHFHDLRHTTAALLLQMEVSMTIIQAILGFRQRSAILKTLTPVSLSMQKEVMKKWDDLLNNA